MRGAKQGRNSRGGGGLFNKNVKEPLLSALSLLSYSLEEGIGEDGVRLGRSVQITNACVKRFGIDNSGVNRGFANALDHRGEGFSGEPVGQVWSARVHVNHSWRHVNRL